MIADIRKHLAKTAFEPFTIRTADGQNYPVPTRDHIWLPPKSSRVFVADDEGYSAILPALLISGLVVKTDYPGGDAPNENGQQLPA